MNSCSDVIVDVAARLNTPSWHSQAFGRAQPPPSMRSAGALPTRQFLPVPGISVLARPRGRRATLAQLQSAISGISGVTGTVNTANGDISLTSNNNIVLDSN